MGHLTYTIASSQSVPYNGSISEGIIEFGFKWHGTQGALSPGLLHGELSLARPPKYMLNIRYLSSLVLCVQDYHG